MLVWSNNPVHITYTGFKRQGKYVIAYVRHCTKHKNTRKRNEQSTKQGVDNNTLCYPEVR